MIYLLLNVILFIFLATNNTVLMFGFDFYKYDNLITKVKNNHCYDNLGATADYF
jgi:hypothetical protein